MEGEVLDGRKRNWGGSISFIHIKLILKILQSLEKKLAPRRKFLLGNYNEKGKTSTIITRPKNFLPVEVHK